jgi:hypothetical protein
MEDRKYPHQWDVSRQDRSAPKGGRGLSYARRKSDRTIVPSAIDKPEDAMCSTQPNFRNILYRVAFALANTTADLRAASS